MTLPTTHQFRSATTQSGKRAFEAYVAIYANNGKHMMIGAPTLEALKDAWLQVTESTTDLNPIGAQHVWIVRADSELKDAPDVSPAAAKAACNFCGRQASFIIHRIATCERAECRSRADGM